jgi:hypothetical protein
MEDAAQSASSVSAFVQGNISTPTGINNNPSSLDPMLANSKLLPWHYSECEFSDLVELIGMFSHVDQRFSGIKANRTRPYAHAIDRNQRRFHSSLLANCNQDRIPISPENLTRFHSR